MSPALPLALQCLAELRLSAASALVWNAGELFLLADDELYLQCYSLDGAFLAEHCLLDEQLPEEPLARKALKPDFEMLCQLPQGWLLALGSGSTEQRRRAVLWRQGEARRIDLTPLYLALEAQLPQLNLEGAVVQGDRLLLAQRGNGKNANNALISLDLPTLMTQLEGARLDSDCLRQIIPLQIGHLDGVALTFTDLCLDLRGRLLFSATAEDTLSTYADGPCLGSALGWIDGDRVQALWPLPGAAKIEGLCMVADGSLRLINDPDDRAARSCRYSAQLPEF